MDVHPEYVVALASAVVTLCVWVGAQAWNVARWKAVTERRLEALEAERGELAESIRQLSVAIGDLKDREAEARKPLYEAINRVQRDVAEISGYLRAQRQQHVIVDEKK